MASVAVGAVLACVSLCAGSINSPPVVNAGFEDNVLLPGQRTFTFIAWYDSQCWVEYATGASGNGIPAGPDGSQWCGLPGNGKSTNRGYIYQRIGTWNGAESVSITLLIGKRQGVDSCPLRVAVWVGGNAALAANDVVLNNVGATIADSRIVTADFGGLDMGVVEMNAALSTGTGYVQGDPIWLEFKSDGTSSTAQLYIDQIRIGQLETAGNPQPADGLRSVRPDGVLTWMPPDIPGASCTLYFGTNPDVTANASTTNVSPPFDPGVLDYMTAYYWRIDTIDGPATHIGGTWSFTTGGKAVSPVPFDGGTSVMTSTIDLSWQADPWATSFKVYASTDIPLQYRGEAVLPVLHGFVAGKADTTYFWRVDEYVNGQPTIPGDVWRFTTGPRPAWSCPAGDLNGDCQVDAADLMSMARQWLWPLDCGGALSDCADIAGGSGVDNFDFAMMTADWQKQGNAAIVINEIHCNPDAATELVEFVELYNAGDMPADISGWGFRDGISYTFPAGTILNGGAYIVVAEDAARSLTPVTVAQKYGAAAAKVFGPFTGGLRGDGEKITFCDADGVEIDRVEYGLGFPWPTVGDAVPPTTTGTGHSMQLINPAIDNDLGGSWRSAYPTPGGANAAVFAANAPPHIRQVRREPGQPATGDTATITARVTDADGIGSVVLLYQAVPPGQYVRLTDAAYGSNWSSAVMRDDGIGGDEWASDDVFTAQLPASVNVHRRLIRYRVRVQDATGNTLTVPYADDPQPNFAYFVYDGVPAWRGALEPQSADPGRSAMVTFGAEVMQALPVYHLIAAEGDVTNCQYNGGYENTRFRGTLVYDGEVYDHCEFKVRGEYSTYQSGKNKWKLFFLRGHELAARDDYGVRYNTKWEVLNLGACATPWMPAHRGMAGIDESLAMALYNKSGVPAPMTHALQLRIIDNAAEAIASSQYEGDLWGLYLAIEYPDGGFLDERGLPDGNTYKMEGSGDLKNQGPTQPSNGSDLTAFRNGYNQTNTVSWWKQNLNLEHYYGFRSIDRAINNMDLREGWNVYYYHNPDTNLWTTIPWDLDMLYMPVHHWSGVLNIQNCLNHEEFAIGYRNYGRHLQDLLLSSDQIGQLVDELASVINPPGRPLTMVDVDEFMWNYHPRTASSHRGMFYKNPVVHNDFDGQSVTKVCVSSDHEGEMQWIKDFIQPAPGGGSSPASYGANFLTSEVADAAIPGMPTVRYTGPAGCPINGLQFETSGFADPQGAATFAGMKWRLAEVEPYAAPSPVEPSSLTLIANGDTWRYFKGTIEPSNPVTAWRTSGFNDDPASTAWLTGALPIGYGVGSLNTTLGDMRSYYWSVYLRKTFEVRDAAAVKSLTLKINYDEGLNIWINGARAAWANVGGENLACTAAASSYISGQASTEATISNPQAYLVNGDNVIAVQVLNNTIGSSDLLFALTMTAEMETSGSGSPPSQWNGASRGKYEIDAVWQSALITNAAQRSIRIPATAVRSGRMYRVRCRMLDNTGRWSHWSDPNQFTAGDSPSAGILENLRITEVMYNPAAANTAKGELNADNDDFEFVEVKNIGDETLDLSNVSFSNGVTFSFGAGRIRSLSAGAFVLVARNEAAFRSRYGVSVSGRLTGQYTRSLNNAGERIALVDTWNGTIADFDYNDEGIWPLAADGTGHSLIPLAAAVRGQPDGTADYGANWRASAFIDGSPADDDAEPPTGPVLNEIAAHTDYSDPGHPGYDSNDWIELFNAAGSTVQLNADWYLSDDKDDLAKWSLPSTVIPSGGRISFDEVHDFHNPITTGFGLDKAGEELFLSHLPAAGPQRVVDCLRFKGQESGVSIGRIPDGGAFWVHQRPTRNLPNGASVADIAISEIMYHAPQPARQYIELYNPADAAVVLHNTAGGWRLDGGIGYVFDPTTSIPPHGRLVVVDFDPAAEPAVLTGFQTFYGTGPLTPNVNIVGPFSGPLSDITARVALERPQAPDTLGGPVSWVIIDEAIYFSRSPWPALSYDPLAVLQRQPLAPAGNDPRAWRSATPTPGGQSVASADLDGDGRVDMKDAAIFSDAWRSGSADASWNAACDLAFPPDGIIGPADLYTFTAFWLWPLQPTP